jgi:hypothetical protein
MKIRWVGLLPVIVLMLTACSTFSYDHDETRNANTAHNECMRSAPQHRVTASNYDRYMQKCMEAKRNRPSGD